MILAWQCPDGGFGGGPGQHAHLLTAYASVCALAIVGRPILIQVLICLTMMVGTMLMVGESCSEECAIDCYTESVWSRFDLQKYILCAAQHPAGGLRDKPPKYVY